MPHIQVVVGSTREGRFSEQVTSWVVAGLEAHRDLTVEVVDLREFPLPFFDAPPPAYTRRDYPGEDVARFGRTLDRADGFVVLTPEYNHGYPAVLKNAIDHTFVEWHRKPITFVGWGNVGGARAIEQLREVAVELEMAPLRHAVHILGSHMVAINREGRSVVETLEPLLPKRDLMVDDLAWWSVALAAARAT